MNILKNISNQLTWRNARFIIFIIIGLFLFSDLAFADTVKTAAETDAGAWLNKFVNIIVRWAAAFLWALTALISLFLTPGWVNGELFELWWLLKEIWVMISNIVYLIFALILIVIAFMNIVWKWEWTWELKQALPKFIVGVLIVPFSWFFVQFIISISSILTVSVLWLPFDSFEWKADEADNAIQAWIDKGKDEPICVKHVIHLWKLKDTSKDTNWGGSEKWDNKIITCDTSVEESKMRPSEIIKKLQSSDSIFGLINLYTYGVMELDELETTTLEEMSVKWGIKDILDLSFFVLFDFVFLVMYLILMVALFMALFSRGIYLWIYMMFSSVFGLLYFFDKAGSWIGDAWERFNIKEFIGLAMVPVYVSAALSFGLLFLFVAGNSTTMNQAGDSPIKIGIFSVKFEAPEDPKNATSVSSSIGEVIIKIFGLAILWMGVMAALNGSKTTGKIIEPIQQFGNSVWELVSKAPQYAPIIPTPGGMVSAQWLKKIWDMPQQALQAKVAKNVWWHQKFFDNLLGANTISMEERNNVKRLLQNWIESHSELKWIQNKLKPMIASNWLWDPVVQELIKEFAQALKDKNQLWMKDVNLEKLFNKSDTSNRALYGILHLDGLDKRISEVNTTTASDYVSSRQNGNQHTKDNSKQNATSDKTIDLNIKFNEYAKWWKIIDHDTRQPDRNPSDVRKDVINALAKTILAKNEKWSEFITEQAFTSQINDELASDDKAIKELIDIIKNQRSDFFKEKDAEA